MKKHSVNKFPVPSIHSIVATQKLPGIDNRRKKAPVATTVTTTMATTSATVPPPDEETLLLLNKIAKESPFCFYYKGRSDDML